jgi:cytochrome P450
MTTRSDTDPPTGTAPSARDAPYADTADAKRPAAEARLSGGESLHAVLGDPQVQGREVWALCDWLRRNDPVHRTDSGFTVVTRHRDVVRVLTDEKVLVPDIDTLAQEYQGAVKHRALAMTLNNLASTNPPRHTRLKRLAAGGFTQRAVQGAAASVRAICEALLAEIEEPLRDGAAVDLFGLFAERLALDVISTLVGVPDADRPWMARLVRAMLAFADPGVGAAGLAAADEAVNSMEDYFSVLVEQRRRAPRADLTSAWSAQSGDDSLAPEELLSVLWLLWMAGFETAAAAICDATIAAIEHPGAAPRPDDGADGLRAFLDESMRYNPPVLTSGVLRIAGEDLVLEGGETIPKGSRVTAVIGAANHDPEVYADPERFDPGRVQAPSLSFGRGIHTCLGVPLARLELEVALMGMRNRLPALELAEEPRRRGGLPLRTFTRLMVRAA